MLSLTTIVFQEKFPGSIQHHSTVHCISHLWVFATEHDTQSGQKFHHPTPTTKFCGLSFLRQTECEARLWNGGIAGSPFHPGPPDPNELLVLDFKLFPSRVVLEHHCSSPIASSIRWITPQGQSRQGPLHG